MPGHTHQVPTARRPGAASGFTFVELLFAMAVLGIGFIMVAAIFPAGLLQTKMTMDETTGAAGSRSAAANLQKLAQGVAAYAAGAGSSMSPLAYTYATTAALPTVAATDIGRTFFGTVRTLNDPRPFGDGMVDATKVPYRRSSMWQSMANDLINPADPRNASVVMYKRDVVGTSVGAGPDHVAGSSTAQVIVINTQVINQSSYVAADVTLQPDNHTPKQAIYNLEARPVAVQVCYDAANGNYVASFFSVTQLDDRGGYPSGTSPSGNAWDAVLDEAVNAVDTGAFFVISDDRIERASASAYPGVLNGRTFRLGQRRTDLSGLTFDLAPGYGFTPDPGKDGVLNASGTPSQDDLVGIGIDKDTTSLRCGLNYTIETPKGTGGPNGTNVKLLGTPTKKGAVALVVGRGFSNSVITPPGKSGVSSAYAGPVQDVSLYTTFVTVPNQ